MKKRPAFRNINVLVADSDPCLAQVVVQHLRAMGFSHSSHAKSAEEALRLLNNQSVSFLITEWDIKGGSGIDLVRHIRRAPDSPNRGLPILMLTGRGELPDVRTARDAGITEFVVKPFSAQTLFNRIEQIIDHPRGFVLAPGYVGPERRRRGKAPEGAGERRTTKAITSAASRVAIQNMPAGQPIIFGPDFGLKQQMGTKQPLSEIITAEVLQEAQAAISSMSEDSMKWIFDDLRIMREAFDGMRTVYNPKAMEKLKEAALSIKARAGTFGYSMASDVARLLYLFLSTDFEATNPRHLVVIDKHLQVLMVILAQKIKMREGVGAELYSELERLIDSHR